MRADESIGHGLGAALAAVSVPDAWLSFGERIVMAIVVAIFSTLASRLVGAAWKKVGK